MNDNQDPKFESAMSRRLFLRRTALTLGAAAVGLPAIGVNSVQAAISYLTAGSTYSEGLTYRLTCLTDAPTVGDLDYARSLRAKHEAAKVTDMTIGRALTPREAAAWIATGNSTRAAAWLDMG